IASGAATLKALDAQTLLEMSGKSTQLQHAPPVLREELVLPYAAGFALVAEAYRRGGFALVDRMFKNPPVSTHQILHPDAYFAGEVPVLVPAPPPPDGTHAIATGRMGELGTRLALEACVEKEVLKDFAPRWAGDAYTIVEGPKNALSLLWTTAWSSGVAGNVSGGCEADVSTPVAELAIRTAGAGGATISFVPEALTGETLDAFFQTASAQIAASQGGHLTYLGKTQQLLAGVPAEQRSWAV